MGKKNKSVALPSIEQVENERRALKKKKEFNKAVRNVSGVLIVVAAVSVLIATLLMPVLQISGVSMEPTLHDKDVVILVNSNKPKTGDLVGFYYQSKILLKRVIGQPGDVINIDEDGTVFVNGQELDEPYVNAKSFGQCDIAFPYQVPEKKYFVLGDNRETSIDSRNTVIGCVDSEQFVGVVVFRVWPLKDISRIK